MTTVPLSINGLATPATPANPTPINNPAPTQIDHPVSTPVNHVTSFEDMIPTAITGAPVMAIDHGHSAAVSPPSDAFGFANPSGVPAVHDTSAGTAHVDSFPGFGTPAALNSGGDAAPTTWAGAGPSGAPPAALGEWVQHNVDGALATYGLDVWSNDVGGGSGWEFSVGSGVNSSDWQFV